jgi:hypothetical protein
MSALKIPAGGGRHAGTGVVKPFSRRAHQRMVALMPKIGIPSCGSSFSVTAVVFVEGKRGEASF